MPEQLPVLQNDQTLEPDFHLGTARQMALDALREYLRWKSLPGRKDGELVLSIAQRSASSASCSAIGDLSHPLIRVSTQAGSLRFFPHSWTAVLDTPAKRANLRLRDRASSGGERFLVSLDQCFQLVIDLSHKKFHLIDK